MMLFSYNGLFAAEFQVPTLVQAFFVIQCLWTGIMGVLCTYDPKFSSAISETGVFRREGSKEKFAHPNVRSAWSVRGGSMFMVAAGALYFGTRETYLVALAAKLYQKEVRAQWATKGQETMELAVNQAAAMIMTVEAVAVMVVPVVEDLAVVGQVPVLVGQGNANINSEI